jgi:hypothetical protein
MARRRPKAREPARVRGEVRSGRPAGDGAWQEDGEVAGIAMAREDEAGRGERLDRRPQARWRRGSLLLEC